MHTFGRRAFLSDTARTLACTSLVPTLSASRVAGQAATPPKRLVIIFTPNGTVPGKFWPGANFSFGPILEPLLPYRDRMLTLKGIRQESRGTGPGNVHTMAIGHLLTGRPLLEGDLVDGSGNRSGYASGISIDQEVANAIGSDTRFRSLALGVRVRVPATPVRARISYRGPNQPIVPNDNPYNVASQLFQDAVGGPNEAEQIWARRKSILDHSTAEIGALSAQLGSHDRDRLAAHLQSISEIEKSLQPTASKCEPLTLKSGVDFGSQSAYPEVSRMQLKLLARAFACDATRVATILYSSAQSSQKYTWLNIDRGHHSLSHDSPNNSSSQDKLTKINRWHAEELRFFLDELEQARDPDGSSVLDNTLVVWCNEIGDGDQHSKDNLPFLLAGGVGGFRMGRNVSFNKEPHNNVLVTIANAFGLGLSNFGDPRFCTGPLDGLT